MTPPRNWRSFARSLDEDPELHYPVGTTGPALIQAEQAKSLCRRCVVRQHCLDEAMRMEAGTNAANRYGIRGGLDENERANLHKRTIKQRAAERARQAVVA